MSTEAERQDWPELLRKLAETLGESKTLELADRFGGIPVYVPLKYSPRHLWIELLTEDEWPKVAAVCGGQHVCLPRGTFLHLLKRRIFELAEQGLSTRNIALALRVSQRHVQRVIAGVDLPPRSAVDPRQGKLFD